MKTQSVLWRLSAFGMLFMLTALTHVASQDTKRGTTEDAQKVPAAPRVSMSEGESLKNLISRVEPVYPPRAKTARIQGAVVLEIVISTEGTVQRVRVLSGHPLLVEAGVRAAKQYRYRTFKQEGKPVEVVTTVTVNFSLDATPDSKQKGKNVSQNMWIRLSLNGDDWREEVFKGSAS